MKAKKKHIDSDSSIRNTFSETLLKISYRFSLPKIFDDFLTIAIAACTQNPLTKISYYEDEYLQIIKQYKNSELGQEIPKAFAQLIMEMEERVRSDVGNDVLGDFFERELSHGRNGQFFTPYPICRFMASTMAGKTVNNEAVKEDRPLRILDRVRLRPYATCSIKSAWQRASLLRD